MRTSEEIAALLDISLDDAQAVTRHRDAFADIAAVSSDVLSAVDDHILAIVIAVGRDENRVWRFSPVMLYSVFTASMALQNFGKALSGLVSQLSTGTPLFPLYVDSDKEKQER